MNRANIESTLYDWGVHKSHDVEIAVENGTISVKLIPENRELTVNIYNHRLEVLVTELKTPLKRVADHIAYLSLPVQGAWNDAIETQVWRQGKGDADSEV